MTKVYHKLDIYTDGSCRQEQGGWGAVILGDNLLIYKIYGGEIKKTTNCRMELASVIRSCIFIYRQQLKFTQLNFYTDSQYVANGVLWLNRWQADNWLSSAKQPVKNQDLWLKIMLLKKHFSMQVNWIQGHRDNKYNIEADILANLGRNKTSTC